MSAARVRCALMRGGTSKGLVFLASDLPNDPAVRDDLLLRLMGSPDPRQIDGLGGAHPLTSKVGIVSPAAEDGVDVDYLFLQVNVAEPVVSSSQTCGNILAAVGPFAVERGLVPAQDGVTDVRVRMTNNATIATVRVSTPQRVVTYDGDVRASGVPGTAAPVTISIEGPTGNLFPTGSVRDELAGLTVTCVDNGMPTVIVRAADLGRTGDESPEELEGDEELVRRVHELRVAAVHAMDLSLEVETSTVPKIVLVSPPLSGGAISTRSFIPVRVHQAVGVLGAASIAAAAAAPGTVAHDVAEHQRPGEAVRIEHPTGFLDVSVGMDDAVEGHLPTASTTSVVRSARLLMDGLAHPGPPRTVEPPT